MNQLESRTGVWRHLVLRASRGCDIQKDVSIIRLMENDFDSNHAVSRKSRRRKKNNSNLERDLFRYRYCNIIYQWDLFLTCSVAFKFSPEPLSTWKNTISSKSIIDRCWTRGQSETTALSGWSQSEDQNGCSVKNKLMGNPQSERMNALSCSLYDSLFRPRV